MAARRWARAPDLVRRCFAPVLAALALACAPAAPPPGGPLAELDPLFEGGRRWLLANQRSNGLFVYRFDPAAELQSSRNNALRQLMASRLVAELGAAGDPAAQAAHEPNLAFVLRHWLQRRDGLAYVVYANKSKLGANAMLLRTLTWSRDFERYRPLAAEVAAGIGSLLAADGSFEPWLIEPRYAYDRQRLLYFYSGEAILALAEHHLRSGEPASLEMARRAQDHYLVPYVQQIEQHYYPAYVPWHAMSLTLLFHLTDHRPYADAAFLLLDRLLEIQDRDRYPGRFFDPALPEYGKPHASSDGIYTEGLAYGWGLARFLGDAGRANLYADALELAVANLRSLQYRPPQGDPRLLGGLRLNAGRADLRVDNVQHALDAARKLFEVRDGVDRCPGWCCNPAVGCGPPASGTDG